MPRSSGWIMKTLFKAGVRATPQQCMLMPTARILDLLSIAGLRQQLEVRRLVLVYMCLGNLASPFFLNLSKNTTSDHTFGRQCIICGQASNLLLVPFVLEPACRTSVAFQGSILWNSLPAEARSRRVIQAFNTHLKNIAPDPSN